MNTISCSSLLEKAHMIMPAGQTQNTIPPEIDLCLPAGAPSGLWHSCSALPPRYHISHNTHLYTALSANDTCMSGDAPSETHRTGHKQTGTPRAVARAPSIDSRPGHTGGLRLGKSRPTRDAGVGRKMAIPGDCVWESGVLLEVAVLPGCVCWLAVLPDVREFVYLDCLLK